MEGQTPTPIREFYGRYNRGEDESVPPGHFSDELNIIFTRAGFKTRPGFSAIAGITANIRRQFEYKRIGEASRYIILDTTGKFFDSTNMATPILDIPGCNDFALIVLFNRAYISPHDRVTGLTSQKIYVYEGTGTARAAAGQPPSGYTLVVAEGAATGNLSIEAGVHLFSVAFKTSSGFITAPGLAGNEFKKLTATGGKEVNISAIPTGPAGTASRFIMVTKVQPDYKDGSEKFVRWYFLPNGEITDNTTTVLNNVKFLDISLVDSADDYIFQLSEIPAGVFLVDFEGRMVSGGEATSKSLVRVSKVGQPESFSSTDGFNDVYPGDAGGGVTNAIAHRSMFYVSKGQRFYVGQDNGSSPSSWKFVPVDSGLGTECFGISKVLDSQGHSRDQFLVAARSGLFQYLGAFAERELTWKIRDDWARINQQYFNQIQLALDPQREWIFVAVPLDSATEPSHLFFCDYSEALDTDSVKWSIWQLPKKVTSVLVRVDDTTKKTFLVVGSSEGSAYKFDETVFNDWSNFINSYFESHQIGDLDEAGISQFAGVRVRILGSGTQLSMTMYSLDRNVNQVQQFSLPYTSGHEMLCKFDLQSERVTIRVGMQNINNWFEVSRMTVFSSKVWNEIP